MSKTTENIPCKFCHTPDVDGWVPRDASEFYAGRSKQLDVDKFDEYETDEVNFCPVCGRRLTAANVDAVTTLENDAQFAFDAAKQAAESMWTARRSGVDIPEPILRSLLLAKARLKMFLEDFADHRNRQGGLHENP